MSKQYVQHNSGTGQKFPVLNERPSWLKDGRGVSEHEWLVQGISQHLLPKSEYRLCEPPERWVVVTWECELKVSAMNKQQIWHKGTCIDGAVGYKLRKVLVADLPGVKSYECDDSVFIVEKQEP